MTLLKDELMEATGMDEAALKKRLVEAASENDVNRKRVETALRSNGIKKDSWAYVSMFYLSANPSDLKERMLKAINA